MTASGTGGDWIVSAVRRSTVAHTSVILNPRFSVAIQMARAAHRELVGAAFMSETVRRTEDTS